MGNTNMLAAGAIRGSAPIVDIYAAWKRTDAAARSLDRQVKETWSRYERGAGAFPSAALLREAAALRYQAREKLGDVVGLLRQAGQL